MIDAKPVGAVEDIGADIERHVLDGDLEAAGRRWLDLLAVEQAVAQTKKDAERSIRKAVDTQDPERPRGPRVLRLAGIGAFTERGPYRVWDKDRIVSKLRGGAVSVDGEQLSEAEALVTAFSLGTPRVGGPDRPGLLSLGLEPRDFSTWEDKGGVSFLPADGSGR